MTLRGEAIARDVKRHRDERKVGVKFSAVLRVVPEGGQIEAAGEHIEVRDADSATLLLAAATDFRSPDPTAACEQALLAADRSYALLRAAHVARPSRTFPPGRSGTRRTGGRRQSRPSTHG